MSSASPSPDSRWSAGGPGGLGTLGRYRLCSELGRGGMGVVYLAVDERGRAVAVKVLRDHVVDDAAARARLAREVDLLSRIRHPGVAGIVAADVHGSRPYVVTRYIPGPPLDRYIGRHGPLRPEQLLSLAGNLSDALSAVHAAGVVHRDLKPANVLLHDGHPVLIDFGIAYGADDARITSTGLVMGTPGFLAPEILDGAKVTAATDWWAWAATLAFAASGRVPFGEGPVDAVLARIRGGECDMAGVDPRLAPLLRSALAPAPGGRPTQGQILTELERYAAGGIATEVLPAVPPTEVIPKAATTPVPAAPYRVEPMPPYRAEPAAPYRGAAQSWSGDEAPSNSPGRRGWAGTAGERAPHGLGGAPPRDIAAPPPTGPIRRRRRRGVIAAGMALLAAATLVAPIWALLAGIGWTWLARTVERAVVGLNLRRGEYGVRRGDVAGTVLRSPAYAVGAAVGSLVAAILPTVAGFCALAGAITLRASSVAPGVLSDVAAPGPLLAGAAAGMLVAWWGPGGSRLRRGTRMIVRAVTPGQYGTAVVAGLLALAAVVIGLISQSSGFQPSWAPLGEEPFGWVRGLARGS